jgi:tetratricopeptide (TPR) repeat protein
MRLSLKSVLMSLAVIMILTANSSLFQSHAWRNAGMLALIRALTATGPAVASKEAARAEVYLERAVSLNSDSESLWLGIGFAEELQGRTDEALAAWRSAAATAWDFILSGEQSIFVGEYEMALKWFDRAAILDPLSGDPWYYMGLAYEDSERWDQALDAYERAIEKGSFGLAGSSGPWCRMAMIYALVIDPPLTKDALSAYESAMLENDFGTAPGTPSQHRTANCHFEYGDLIRQLEGSDAAPRYTNLFERALEFFPEHYRARVLLGAAYYERDGNLEAAEREIGSAIRQAPQNKRAYFVLASIYSREEMRDQAAGAFNRILEIDPNDVKASKRLLDLQGTSKEHE